MKKLSLLLIACLIFVQLSCEKDPYRLPDHAKFDVNGSTWKTKAALLENGGRLDILMATIDPCTEDFDYRLDFVWVEKTMERQYLKRFESGMPLAPTAIFYRLDYDVPLFSAGNTLHDTAHNFIQIVHQEDDYTKNVKAIFSVTATTARDTYYIRNGIVDFSKKMK